MKNLFRNMVDARENILGINERNISFVYRYNQRRDFKIADDKFIGKSLLESKGIPVPETYALIDRSGMIDRKIRELNRYPSMVVKPARGGMGQGILILKKVSDLLWETPGGEKIGFERLKLHMAGILYGAYTTGDKDRVIVEFLLSPHKLLNHIYNEGIPDLRILLYLDQPVMAMLRVPTRKSNGKANLHQGAMGIGVNLKDGTLQEGFYKGKYWASHPDSGSSFSGLALPYWENTLETAIDTARCVPLKYLGVDIILDESRGPLVIEINARPGLQIQNVNRAGLKPVLKKKGI